MTPMACRAGCAACCVAPSISSPLPGLPDGKPAGVPCPALDRATGLCRVWGGADYPPVCRAFTATPDLCGATREEALERLARLERLTAPAPPNRPPLARSREIPSGSALAPAVSPLAFPRRRSETPPPPKETP